jgi:hypothetical protein
LLSLRAAEHSASSRIGDLLDPACHLRVISPVGRIVGAALESEARISLQVDRLQRHPHHAEPQLAVLELDLDPADPR